jgi:hypothetical protein
VRSAKVAKKIFLGLSALFVYVGIWGYLHLKFHPRLKTLKPGLPVLFSSYFLQLLFYTITITLYIVNFPGRKRQLKEKRLLVIGLTFWRDLAATGRPDVWRHEPL